jgi:hypothetical protein
MSLRPFQHDCLRIFDRFKFCLLFFLVCRKMMIILLSHWTLHLVLFARLMAGDLNIQPRRRSLQETRLASIPDEFFADQSSLVVA